MQTDEAPIEPSTESRRFIHQVDQRLVGELPAPGDDSNRTAAVVLNVLAQCLSGAKTQQMAEAFGGIVPVIEGHASDDDTPEDGAPLGFDDFIARVVQRAGTTEDAAHRVTRAVFGELQRQLPPETSSSIAGRLPADLRAAWAGPDSGGNGEAVPRQPPEVFPTRQPPAELRAISHPLLDRIEAEVELPPPLNGAAVFVATLCLVMLRLTAERAAELRHGFPDVLQDLLFRCTQQREEDATRFGEAEFLETLGTELGVSTGTAERIASGVLRVVSESLPADEVKRIAAQLPKGLNVLFSGGHVARVTAG